VSARSRRARFHRERIERAAGLRRLEAAYDYLRREAGDTHRAAAEHAIAEAADAVTRIADALNDRKETH
jgi:hypothetical protein